MNSRDIDLNLLVILDVLIAEKNVTRAAAKVGLTQSAVSNALNRLRDAFEDPLLVRTRDGMVPTAVAKELIQPLNEVIGALNQLFSRRAKFDARSTELVFKVGATDYAELVLMPHILKRVKGLAPKAQFETRTLKEQIPKDDLADGELDLAIGFFNRPPGNLIQKKLFIEDFVCVGLESLFPKRKALTLKEFAVLDHLIVAPWGGMWGMMDRALLEKGLTRRVRASTPHFLVAPQIAKETGYVVTLPRRMANAITPNYGLAIRELPVKLPDFVISMIWHPRTHELKSNQWLRNEIIAEGESLR